MSRLTKIVCTLGPSTSDLESIEELVNSGMDFARLNFSHGDYDEHQHRIDILKKMQKSRKGLKIMQDLPGPKIRTGKINGRIILKDGSNIKLVKP